MLIRLFIEVAVATSTLNFLSIIITFLSFSTDNALSQSVIKNLMMMSPEWTDFQDADIDHIHHRSRRTAVNPKEWFMPTKGCYPTCRKGVSADVCSNPPTRKELCTLLNNEDWCCQEWAFSRPQSLSFKANCDVICVAYAPCPYSTCRLCAEINNEHACCQARNCTTKKVFKTPDGTAMMLTEYTPQPVPMKYSSMAVYKNAPSTDTCPDPPDTICNHFNGKPGKCRQASGCAYLCASGSCVNSGSVYGNECYDDCFNHCYDKCGCTARTNCLWNGGRGTCLPKPSKFCNVNNFKGKECARKNVYYSIGGIICFNKVQKGYCDLDFVVASANLGSDVAKTDSEGIEYVAEADAQKEDPLGLSQPISFVPEDIIDDSYLDQQIYATAVVGNAKPCRGEKEQCIHYVIPSMTWDGDYELGLRIVEGVYSERNKRRFSVRFADVEICSEFDILSYTGEKNKAMDLYANFKVSQKGKMITVKGHKTRPLNSTGKLSLCRAECGQDNSFIMSGFHVIKQMESKPKTPCDLSKIQECDAKFFTADECKRGYENTTYYSFGGQYCKSSNPGADNGKNCAVVHVKKAINLGGLALVDSRGIGYEQDSPTQSDDVFDAKRDRNSYREAVGYNSSRDRDLYNTLTFVDPGVLKECSEVCVTYTILLDEDGHYELAVRSADDESDGPDQRKFNVLLGNTTVFPEVDLFHLTQVKSQAVDLTLNFDVTDNGTKIRLKGFSPPDDVTDLPDHKGIQLSFCASQCENIKSRSWLVGGFSLVRYGPTPGSVASPVKNATCASFDQKSHCFCKRTTFCERNYNTKECRERNKECGPSPPSKCRKGYSGHGQLYVESGVFCLNPNSSSTSYNCEFDTVFGVNFGSDARDHTDADGIVYKRESAVTIKDTYKIKEGGKALGMYATQGFRSADEQLYRSYMKGKVATGSSCIDIDVPARGNGRYELVIRMGEYDYYNKSPSYFYHRDNSFLFNGVYISESFEPLQYIDDYKQVLTLRIPYKIFGNADKMLVDGFNNLRPVTNATMLFKFCPGNSLTACKATGTVRDFKVGAFAAIKLKTPNFCADADEDSCSCRANRICEYNVESEHCRERTTVCKILKPTGDECRRGGSHVFYTQAGQVCPTTGPSGNCTLDRVMLAVNLGDALPHKDINGIVYATMNTTKFTDPDRIRNIVKNGSTLITAGVPAQDLEIYRTYEYGGKSTTPNIRCLSIKVPTGGDGEYELSIKIGETYYSTNVAPKRAFSYKLNGQYIVQNFEPMVYANPGDAMDLNTNFRIADGGTKLELRGQSSSMISSSDGSVEFEICNGQCSWPGVDNAYRIGAISVVKLKKSRGCEAYNGNACACRFANCQYNVVTQECEEDVKVCASTCDTSNQCQRGGDYVFYVRAGLICTNSVQFGNCEVEKTMVAINFFGPNHTDVNSIHFQSEAGIPYDDPYDVRRNGTAYAAKQYPVEGVPAADLVLYSTSMFGASYNQLQTCVTYHVPTSGDGFYELGLKLAEVWYMKKGQREFSYYFNGQLVVQSLDMAAVRDAPNKGFDLIVNFRVVTDRLQMKGYPHTVIKSADGSVPLAFCPGTCDCDWKDHNFQVAAVFVNKFKNVPSPVNYKVLEIENFGPKTKVKDNVGPKGDDGGNDDDGQKGDDEQNDQDEQLGEDGEQQDVETR